MLWELLLTFPDLYFGLCDSGPPLMAETWSLMAHTNLGETNHRCALTLAVDRSIYAVIPVP